MRGTGNVTPIYSEKTGELLALDLAPGWHSEQETSQAFDAVRRSLDASTENHDAPFVTKVSLTDGTEATLIIIGRDRFGGRPESFAPDLRQDGLAEKFELRPENPVSAAWGSDGIMLLFRDEAADVKNAFLKAYSDGFIILKPTNMFFSDIQSFKPGLTIINKDATTAPTFTMYKRNARFSMNDLKKDGLAYDPADTPLSRDIEGLGKLLGFSPSTRNSVEIVPQRKYAVDIGNMGPRPDGKTLAQVAGEHGFSLVSECEWQIPYVFKTRKWNEGSTAFVDTTEHKITAHHLRVFADDTGALLVDSDGDLGAILGANDVSTESLDMANYNELKGKGSALYDEETKTIRLTSSATLFEALDALREACPGLGEVQEAPFPQNHIGAADAFTCVAISEMVRKSDSELLHNAWGRYAKNPSLPIVEDIEKNIEAHRIWEGEESPDYIKKISMDCLKKLHRELSLAKETGAGPVLKISCVENQVTSFMLAQGLVTAAEVEEHLAPTVEEDRDNSKDHDELG